MVKYPFWVQKLLHYMIQHEGGRHIDFRQISVSPGQTTANNCKTAFSLHVVESASNNNNNNKNECHSNIIVDKLQGCSDVYNF